MAQTKTKKARAEESITEARKSGRRKAAAFFLAIGEANSAKIVKQLDNEDVREVSKAIASLGVVQSREIESLFVEFTERLLGADGLKGNLDTTERLLASVMPRIRSRRSWKIFAARPGGRCGRSFPM